MAPSKIRGPSPAGGLSMPADPAATSVEGMIRSLPQRVRPDRVAGWRARFHCTFTGANRPDWTVVIEDGSCRVRDGLHGDADCALRMDRKTFLGIANGTTDPRIAFLLGRIRVSNLEELLRFVRAFREQGKS
jgi:putative sterol carrier protein